MDTIVRNNMISSHGQDTEAKELSLNKQDYLKITSVLAEFSNLKKQIDALNQKVKNIIEDRNKIVLSAKRIIESYKQKIQALEDENRKLVAQNEDLRKQLKEQQTPKIQTENKASETSRISPGNDSIVSEFNQWGANPAGRLPNDFYYVKGEMQLRTLQSLELSNEETKWIVNKTGSQKYLFPNPRTFDELTDITLFYSMNKANLKPKRQNKIKIIQPCEISDKGWIDYPGELELL